VLSRLLDAESALVVVILQGEEFRKDEETIGEYEKLLIFAVFLAFNMKYLKRSEMERRDTGSKEIRVERCYDLVCYTSDVELRKLHP
jgi:hypothetical protein